MQLSEKKSDKTTSDGTLEIVHVLSGAVLINSAWRMSHYATRDQYPLQPGFYFVLWPEQKSTENYDGNAFYFGPFQTRSVAEELKSRGVSRGIIAGNDKYPGRRPPEPDNSDIVLVQPDRRRSARKALNTNGLLASQGHEPVEVKTVDLSLGGVAVAMPYRMALNQACIVTFDMPIQDKIRRVAAVAEVAYSVRNTKQDFKTGLRFVELDAAGAAAVGEYMEDELIPSIPNS